MHVAGASFFTAGASPVARSCMPRRPHNRQSQSRSLAPVSTKQLLARTRVSRQGTTRSVSWARFEKNVEEEEKKKKSLRDFFEESKVLIRSYGGDSPRWFSPVESGQCRLENSPLLLYLPGLDGVGLGLIRQHHNLAKMFDIWCLHIPVKNRTSFTGLVKLVERTVRMENHRSPNRPIYLVGESLGACIALAVAALNPDKDLVIILSNPATSFEKSWLQPLLPLLEFIPDQLSLSLPYILSLIAGDHLRTIMDNVAKHLPRQEKVEALVENAIATSFYLSVRGDILPRETLLWKLQLLKSAPEFTNLYIRDIKAQTLILSSGKDQLLPNEEEGQRLYLALPNSEIRKFENNGHFLFLEDGVDLVTIIKGAAFYRRGKYHDFASDYIPPTPSEFKDVYKGYRLSELATSPAMLSTLEDGKIVRGLAGIPEEGPVLFIGYHMLVALESAPLVFQFWLERNILVRSLGHPVMFFRSVKEGKFPPLSEYDKYRIMGVAPVSGTNLYKLLSSKSHVLLYPGGVREAGHRKGEEYKLNWPEQPEFVRMAARFGAKIVPFGVVGEDDVAELVFDYNDQMKIPCLRDFIKQLNDEAGRVRTTEVCGEVKNQDAHFPGILPKFPPGRFYYYFGKPIQTEGRKQELRDRNKAQELYLQVKYEVEKCLNFLKKKRETDPYRNMFARLAYQATNGLTTEIPMFEI